MSSVVENIQSCDSEPDVVYVEDAQDAVPLSQDNLEGKFSDVKPLHAAEKESKFLKRSQDVNPLKDKSDKKCIKDPVIIEIFCGSSRVTACLKAIGLTSSFGVDHIKTKAVSTCKVADLSCISGQELMMSWLRAENVVGVFLAPPCGTCSLARCIQLRDSKGRKIPGPVPLRSQFFPEGLPGLSKSNALRVSLANELYAFLGKVLRYADSRGLINCRRKSSIVIILANQVVEKSWCEASVHRPSGMCVWV